MKCNECGAEFEYKSDFCPFCGANIPASYQNSSVTSSGFLTGSQEPASPSPVSAESLYSMTWYKFLVNFALWFSVVSNAASIYIFYTGYNYQGYVDQIYGMLPDLQNLDLFAAAFSAYAAILSIVVIVSLKGYKKNGPPLLTLLYVSNVLFYLIYIISFSSILGGAESTRARA